MLDYHNQCATTWLLEHDSCPQCLQTVVGARDLRHSRIVSGDNRISGHHGVPEIEMNTDEMDVQLAYEFNDVEVERTHNLSAHSLSADVERRSVQLLSDAAQSAPELTTAERS